MSGETLKLQSCSRDREANVEVEREYDGLVEERDLQRPPFHVVPVVALPRFLEVGLDLVLLVRLDSEISGDVKEREEERGGEEVDGGGGELEEHLVFDAFGPDGLGEDGHVVEVAKEQIVGDQHVGEALLLVFQPLDRVDARNDLIRLLQHLL